jgi:hypothetical protein
MTSDLLALSNHARICERRSRIQGIHRPAIRVELALGHIRLLLLISYTRPGPPKSMMVMGQRRWGIGDGAMMFGNDVRQ